MAKNSNAQSAGNNNGLIKALLAVVTIAVIAALALSFMSFSTANQNQSELKAVTAAISKQTEVLANMQGQASPEELTSIIRNEMETARRDELLKPFKGLAGEWDNAKPQLERARMRTFMAPRKPRLASLSFPTLIAPTANVFTIPQSRLLISLAVRLTGSGNISRFTPLHAHFTKPQSVSLSRITACSGLLPNWYSMKTEVVVLNLRSLVKCCQSIRTHTAPALVAVKSLRPFKRITTLAKRRV